MDLSEEIIYYKLITFWNFFYYNNVILKKEQKKVSMHCEEIKALLSSYMDDELTGEQRLMVKEHLASCEECKAILTEYEALSVHIAQLAPQTPDMLAIFRAQKEVQKPKRAKHIRTSKWILRAGAMAAALVLVVLGAKLFAPYGAGETGMRSDKAAEFMLEESGTDSVTREDAPAAGAVQEATPRSNILEDEKSEPLVLRVSASEAQAMIDDLAAFYSDAELQTIITQTKEGYVFDFSEEGLPIETKWQTVLTENNTLVVEIFITEY